MEDLKICSECKGRCCKNNPGIYTYLPDGYEERLGKSLVLCCDVILNPYLVQQMIESEYGLFESLDVLTKEHIITDLGVFNMLIDEGFCTPVDQSVVIYSIRPKGDMDKYKLSPLINSSRDMGNTCIYLTDSGCKLSHDDRPTQCQELIPNKIGSKFNCGDADSDISLYKRCLHFQSELNEIALAEAKRVINDLPTYNSDTNYIDLAYAVLENNGIVEE